jgi:hypothetical protein
MLCSETIVLQVKILDPISVLSGSIYFFKRGKPLLFRKQHNRFTYWGYQFKKKKQNPTFQAYYKTGSARPPKGRKLETCPEADSDG